MNENFEIVVFVIFSILPIAIFILCRVLLNREPTENIRGNIEAAERTCNKAGEGISNAQCTAEQVIGGVKNAQESAERIAGTNRELKGGLKQCEQIIEEIKGQKISD